MLALALDRGDNILDRRAYSNGYSPPNCPHDAAMRLMLSFAVHLVHADLQYPFVTRRRNKRPLPLFAEPALLLTHEHDQGVCQDYTHQGEIGKLLYFESNKGLRDELCSLDEYVSR